MMKLISFFILFLSISINSNIVISQDFNLFVPSNEMYLFSAFSEGSDAYKYNPAVLGLGHKFNGNINLFIENFRGNSRYTNEIDAALNSGSLGLSYRFAKPKTDYQLHTVSFGLGFGNKTFSGGLLGEMVNLSFSGANANFDIERQTKYKFGFGILYRPLNILSTALSIRTNESLDPANNATSRIILGLSVKPLKDIAVLSFDFGFTPYENNFIKENFVKAGFDLMFKGISLNMNMIRYNGFLERQYINLGIGFNFPNAGIKYNNVFSRTNETGFYHDDHNMKTLGSMFSLSFNIEKKKSLIPEQKRILEIAVSGGLQDYSTDDVLFGLLGNSRRSFHELISDIDYSAKDPAVSGMIVKIYPLSTGLVPITAEIEELSNAFTRFRNSGKNITAYLPTDAAASEYFLATFADNIVMPAEGILWYGLNIDVMNIKKFLEKYGVGLQNIYAGKYKLTFQGLLDSTTEEGKEVINRVLDIVYDKMLERLSVGRNIFADSYIKERISQPLSGQDALAMRLIDKLGWYEDAKDLAERNSKLEGNFQSFVNRNNWDNGWSEPDRIAVIGVYSSITTGESQAPDPIQLPIPFFSGGRSTGSETVVRQLEDAFSDPKVKAIILRVDSGGGSALASAEINAAIKRLRKKYKKLFIVSMGGAAASGGYYVSANADRIFADETTVTGSIGVFAAIPHLDSLLRGQKIKIESFKRGEYSDMGIIRPLTENEIQIIQDLINFYYEQFITEVSEGRKISKEEADEIAQGRVWLGKDAFSKKLVDQIGGLYEAMNYTRMKSNIADRHKIVFYPVPGGDKITELVNASIIEHYGNSILELLKLKENEENILDIRY